jgi:hypothetical protein
MSVVNDLTIADQPFKTALTSGLTYVPPLGLVRPNESA